MVFSKGFKATNRLILIFGGFSLLLWTFNKDFNNFVVKISDKCFQNVLS